MFAPLVFLCWQPFPVVDPKGLTFLFLGSFAQGLETTHYLPSSLVRGLLDTKLGCLSAAGACPIRLRKGSLVRFVFAAPRAQRRLMLEGQAAAYAEQILAAASYCHRRGAMG